MTIFDIATPTELLELFGSEEQLAYWKATGLEPDANHADLATVFFWRGEEARVQEHLAQIHNLEVRLATELALYEVIQ